MDQRPLCPRACLHPECSARRRAAALEPTVTIEPTPKVERKVKVESRAGASNQDLAQAPKTTPRRGRGAGRRFTKATAAGAAVARAQRLAPERRREIASRAASTRWSGKTQEAR